jgi:hypothetical protein
VLKKIKRMYRLPFVGKNTKVCCVPQLAVAAAAAAAVVVTGVARFVCIHCKNLQ